MLNSVSDYAIVEVGGQNRCLKSYLKLELLIPIYEIG